MQKIKLRTGLLAAIILGGISLVNAQNMDSVVVRQKLEDKKYTFIAQSANPMRGRVVQLTSVYDLRISGDSVVAALPYYGRAYSAPINPSDNGINFTAVTSEYKSVYRKKRWEITIRPKEVSTVNEMNLIIYPNGRATLQVNSNIRQPISFYGFLSEKK